MRRNTTQRVYYVIHFKQAHEATMGERRSPTKLHEHFADGVNFAPTSETITASWVENAVALHNRIYEVPEALASSRALTRRSSPTAPSTRSANCR